MIAESLGFVRHASFMLQQGAHHLHEEWGDEDVMLPPHRVQEYKSLIQAIRNETDKVESVMRNFERVAAVRKISNEP